MHCPFWEGFTPERIDCKLHTTEFSLLSFADLPVLKQILELTTQLRFSQHVRATPSVFLVSMALVLADRDDFVSFRHTEAWPVLRPYVI
jgi:hypothetical protein